WFENGTVGPWTGEISHESMGSHFGDLDKTGTKETEWISGCAMFFHKSLIEDVGLLDESYFIRVSDVEYSLRARSEGYRLIVDHSSIIHHKESASAGKFGLSYYTARNRWILISNS
ncbi:MAG: glycosyltransferase family 2 protein, partial [Halobacteriaceae archaeon]